MKDKAASLVPCAVCSAPCRWIDDAWVCTRRKACGSEWYPDHGPSYAPPTEPDTTEGPT